MSVVLKNTIKLSLSVALSAIFLWFSFRNVDLHRAWGQLREVPLPFVAGFLACTVVTQLVRIYRWEYLVRPFATLSARASFRISSLGLMFILILPLRLGELARPYLVRQETGAPMSSALGAAAVERTIDGLLITMLFFLTTTALSGEYAIPTALHAGGVASLVLFSGATVVIIAALIAKAPVVRLVRRLGEPIAPRLTHKALELLDAFIEGFRALPSVTTVLAVVFFTGVYWLANALGYYLIMLGFGWDLPVAASFFVVSIMVIAIMIPAAPGFLGTFQGAILAGLSVFGIGDTSAAAYGLVVYPLTVLVVLAFGVPYLFTGRTSVRELMRVPSPEDPPGIPPLGSNP